MNEIDITITEGMDTPWPTHDLLDKLADATDILLHDKDYDGHGWEILQQCMEEARRRSRLIRLRLKESKESS